MSLPVIKYCPGTLKEGHSTYSNTAFKRIFNGRKVSHVLPYDSPSSNEAIDERFLDNKKRISISGVQEKLSIILDKNKLRLIKEGEQGSYILKPIPIVGKNADQMPANEHLSMQIARQVFGMETAENALIFFKNGDAAYITKRFDVKPDVSKLAQEDFASLAGRTPQTHGEDYKYQGSYFELFELLRKYSPAYSIESVKLFKLIMFNYLISNGDAHFKNFSLIETPLGDFRLSPAYDLLNSGIHIEDTDFALQDGLITGNKSQGKIRIQFYNLGKQAGISDSQIGKVFTSLTSNKEKVESLIEASYLNDKIKRNYTQAYQSRLNKLLKS
jgi:serine/threonine-protein kinase HipA